LERPAAPAYGRIVSMRPVLVQEGNTGPGTGPAGVAAGFTGEGDVRGSILGAIGGAPVGISKGKPGTHAAPVEFIVRRDDGQIISVVQANDDKFRTGDRALLTQGAQTRLTRAGA
jgi:outer membrane lipoprotein SlyB